MTVDGIVTSTCFCYEGRIDFQAWCLVGVLSGIRHMRLIARTYTSHPHMYMHIFSHKHPHACTFRLLHTKHLCTFGAWLRRAKISFARVRGSIPNLCLTGSLNTGILSIQLGYPGNG